MFKVVAFDFLLARVSKTLLNGVFGRVNQPMLEQGATPVIINVI